MKLGEKVTVTREYVRVYVCANSYEVRRWQSEAVEPYTGVLIGARTIQDGNVNEGKWEAYRHKKAYLVSTSLYKKPVLVPPYAVFKVIE